MCWGSTANVSAMVLEEGMHSLFIPTLKGGKETLGAAGSGAHCCLLVNQPNMLCLAAVPRAGIPCDSNEPPLLPQA